MAWFPCYKSGGGIKKGDILSSHAAAPGQSGYINFARITVKSIYANHTCFFGIQRRNLGFPIFLSIAFQNTPNTDPGLGAFFYWGSTDYGVYISKKDVSTWDLWSLKSEPYDAVEILQMNVNKSCFDVTFPNGYRDVKEDQWISPIEAGRVAGANHLYDASNGKSIFASLAKDGMKFSEFDWLACWNGYELRATHKNAFTYLKKISDSKSGSHYGLCIPYEDGTGQNDQEWIRTTNNGIIPYSENSSEGKSSLGTEAWPFAECYAKKIVTNQIHASNNFGYTQSSSGHTIMNMTGSFINFTSTGATAHGVSIQTSPSNLRVSIHPLTSAAADLGRSDRIWRDIYANNATIQTSDKNKKKDISYIGEESEYENTKMSNETLVKFVRKLRPCIFLMKDGESGRPHHGFISQDFKEAMDEVGITDHAAYIKSPKTETIEKEIEQEREVYDEIEKKTKTVKETVKIQEEKVIPGEFIEGLRYEEVIPDITRFCQILYIQNQEQQKKIEDLENRIKALESIIKQGA